MTNQKRHRNGQTTQERLNQGSIEGLTNAKIENHSGFHYISGVSTLDVPKPHGLYFCEECDTKNIRTINALHVESPLFVLREELRNQIVKPAIFSGNVRDDFATIVASLFDYENTYWGLEHDVAPDADIDQTARIAPSARVGPRSSIGARTRVFPNAVIGPSCTIGADCLILSGAVIGNPGFGVFRDADGKLTHLPHVGGVVIEDGVEIGPNTTVCAGTIHPTLVGPYVKTDAHVHIAHNVVLGEATIVAACAEISGSVAIGRDVWIGPNATIRDGLEIGDSAFVAIGANVVKSVGARQTVLGNPAKSCGAKQ